MRYLLNEHNTQMLITLVETGNISKATYDSFVSIRQAVNLSYVFRRYNLIEFTHEHLDRRKVFYKATEKGIELANHLKQIKILLGLGRYSDRVTGQ